MTKYFFRLLLLVGAIVGVFAVIGSLLPRGYEFASEIEIEVPRGVVFDELNRLSNWRDWSQWNPAEIAGLTVQYSGADTGVGSTQTWTDVRGSGKLWITKSDRPAQLEYELLFANFPKMNSLIVLSERGTGTAVRWTSRGRLPGGPFYGVFAPFFSTHMEAEYEKSLAKLKQKLESKREPE